MVDHADVDGDGCSKVTMVKDYKSWKVFYRGRMNPQQSKMKGHYGFKTPDFEDDEGQTWKLEREAHS